MALFEYTAFNERGRRIFKIIDAESLEQAKERLKNNDVIVEKISLLKNVKKANLTKDLVIHFTRDLMGLLKSGLPLYESLQTIEEKYRNQKFHFIFLDLADLVKSGKSLSEALKQYPDSFDKVFIAMTEAGEKSGQIEESFRQLYKVISRNEKMKKQIRSSMFYPAFLGSFCLLVLIGLFLFLIPSMKELLEGRQLHPMTKTILGLSDFLNSHFLFVATIFSSLSVFSVWGFKQLKVRNFIKKNLLFIPLFKKFYQGAIIMRFSRVLGSLLSTDVPIVEALKLSRSVMNHKSFEDVIVKAEMGIVQGKKLSEELKESKLIPSLMIRMLKTAEETGNPKEMLEHVADIYEEELERTLQQFTNLLQPVMLLLLGIIVGVVLLSVLLPLTDVSSLI
jgi:general secretion pathway protein F